MFLSGAIGTTISYCYCEWRSITPMKTNSNMASDSWKEHVPFRNLSDLVELLFMGVKRPNWMTSLGRNERRQSHEIIVAKRPWKEHVPFRDAFSGYYLMALSTFRPSHQEHQIVSSLGSLKRSFQGSFQEYILSGALGNDHWIAIDIQNPWKEHVPFRDSSSP